MCGRFTRNYTWKEVQEFLDLIPLLPPHNFQPRYNICPTTTIDAVVQTEAGRELIPMRWGLVPAWWKKPLKELRLATFNARAETVAEKPFFRSAFKRTRCIIPASGYYEWHDTPEGKQPYYFARADGNMITIAGLWDEWKNPETGNTIKSCTMIITEPNKFVAEVHDRMPVILERSEFDPWLSAKAGLELLKPVAENVLLKRPVSKRVNSSRANDDDESLINAIV